MYYVVEVRQHPCVCSYEVFYTHIITATSNVQTTRGFSDLLYYTLQIRTIARYSYGIIHRCMAIIIIMHIHI